MGPLLAEAGLEAVRDVTARAARDVAVEALVKGGGVSTQPWEEPTLTEDVPRTETRAEEGGLGGGEGYITPKL